MSVFAYSGFDNSGDATVFDVLETNALPLLVVWMFFTTQSDYLTDNPPPGFDMTKIANELRLSPTCVQNLFDYAKEHRDELNAAATVFQDIASQGGYQPPGGCASPNTILQFAGVARKVWEGR